MNQKNKSDFKELLAKANKDNENIVVSQRPDEEIKLYKLVALISKTMLKSSYEHLPFAFDQSLRFIGEFLNMDRVYIFTLSPDSKQMSNTHEWCQEKIEPAIEMLQDLDVDIFPWWMMKLKGNEIIRIDDVNAMDENQLGEREILQAQSIKSCLVVPLSLDQKLIGFLGFDSVRHKKKWTDEEVNSLVFVSDIFSSAFRRKSQETKLLSSVSELERILNETVEAFGTLIGVSDPFTQNHQVRTSQLAVAIGKQLNLAPQVIEGIRLAAMIHDIGVIHFPTQIINKTSSLSNKEYALIKTHPMRGYEIVSKIDFGQPVADIVLQHHEKCDGSGYPKGLKGDEILFQAKILSVADTYEAMVSNRPYRKALLSSVALDFLSQNSGTRFDPEVVNACVTLIKDKGFVFWEIED
jgi:HD-GYP domain-containing protein (c-di-GMP phosphodiesterase class II)